VLRNIAKENTGPKKEEETGKFRKLLAEGHP
jgi:hypothetical protein